MLLEKGWYIMWTKHERKKEGKKEKKNKKEKKLNTENEILVATGQYDPDIGGEAWVEEEGKSSEARDFRHTLGRPSGQG